MALQHAVELKRHEMAETLLNAGADPNASIYASGDPISSAYGSGDERMIALLEAHGGMLTAGAIAAFGSVDLGPPGPGSRCTMPRRRRERRRSQKSFSTAQSRRGEPEIVRAALAQIDWRPDDPRWFSLLEQTLRHDSDPAVTEWERQSAPDGFPPVAGTLRSESPRPSYRSAAVRPHPAPQHRRPRVTSHRLSGSRSQEPSSTRARAWSQGQPAEEHAARMGVPVGTAAAGQAVSRARRGSDRGGRRILGHAARVGEEEQPC